MSLSESRTDLTTGRSAGATATQARVRAMKEAGHPSEAMLVISSGSSPNVGMSRCLSFKCSGHDSVSCKMSFTDVESIPIDQLTTENLRETNSERENIHLESEFVSRDNLRCHVAIRTARSEPTSFNLIPSGDSRETKIGHLRKRRQFRLSTREYEELTFIR